MEESERLSAVPLDEPPNILGEPCSSSTSSTSSLHEASHAAAAAAAAA
eukprot:CAMPEP_0171931972 /NCGR_PEP_ID=MMETSP0993-20121228/29925_1 /TAXON_ID=483369 /ORGANISM="non described non described, Strain CCMP2098" /LENGTH=47 /DNA_ID= /DNA_START= /DNA_END= /DNA_ORIENTATION=